MSGGRRDERREPRYPVNLPVRFDSALDFVTEYAENLSSSGLYIRSANPLLALEEFGVELELPGLGTFTLRVRVAHVVSAEMGARFGKPAGAGVEIVGKPPGFDEALREYMRRLGRRRDHTVWCHDDEPRLYFERMGYRSVAMPGLTAMVAELARSAVPVVAVVVPPAAERLVRHVLGPAGEDGLLHVGEGQAELDAILTTLDQDL